MTPDPIYKQIGAVIRARRKALGMTQETLAQALAISRGSLANIETGRQNMLVHQLYRFASILELKRFDLLPEPAPVTDGKDAWKELPMPAGLKTAQKEQIARLIEGVESQSPTKEAARGKSSKR